MDHQPLTVEVLGATTGGQPSVLDRVIGGTVYLDEAKRIGRHLLSITEGRPNAFRVLNQANQPIYEWRLGDEQKT
jgi:fibrillarin-like rRNA methylase